MATTLTNRTWAARLRHGAPLLTLAFALGCVFWFGGARGYLYGNQFQMYNTGQNLALAQNLTLADGLLFLQMRRNVDGSIRHEVYHRFPIGGTVLIKLAIWPFDGDLSAQLVAARALMLAFFCAAALLAYSAVYRLVDSRPIALGSTLLAFSSYYMLVYNDTVTNEVSMGVFAILLVFRAMVSLQQSRTASSRAGRLPKHPFRLLLAAVCVALLLDWRVFALLLPFVLLGLAGEARALAVRFQNDGRSARSLRAVCKRCGAVLLALSRSRFTLLAIFAVLFGGGVLGCNMAREQAYLAGAAANATSAQVSSWKSIRSRTGWPYGTRWIASVFDWERFLRWQFHRVGVMCLPFAASGIGGLTLTNEEDWMDANAPSLAGVGVGATVLCLGGLFVARRTRCAAAARMLLAALALSGFCWALPMRNQTVWPGHDFESVFYVGLPLALFTLVALAGRHWLGKIAKNRARMRVRTARALCCSCALIFALSSYRAAAATEPPGDAANILLAEFETIRALTRGKDVHVAVTRTGRGIGPLHAFLKAPAAFQFAMSGTVLHYAGTLNDAVRAEAQGAVDFVLTTERVALRAPRTPTHRFVYLYDAGGVADALAANLRRRYGALAARAPLASSTFDLHLTPRAGAPPEVAYVKQPCRAAELAARFFLDVWPARGADLRAIRHRKGYDRIYFRPMDYVLVFDDKCLFHAPLPEYPVRSIRTGAYPRGGPPAWNARTRIDLPALRRARAAAQGAAAAAGGGGGAFDVFHRGRTLTYARAPCAAEDVSARFFLHAFADGKMINLDFVFGEHGARFDGECVATVPLPDSPIAKVSTGQFRARPGRAPDILWRAAFDVPLSPHPLAPRAPPAG